MTTRTIWALFCCVILRAVISNSPAWALGDKVIPQVADGTGPDGTQFRTKFDITNLGPYETQRISNTVRLLFFRQNGTPWVLPVQGYGNVSEIALNLSAYQTIRIETQGTSPALTSGYAIIRNLETDNSRYPEDYEVGITVYYEILKNQNVVDTVSVPVGQPAYTFVLPVDNDPARNLYSGLAMVNLDSSSNQVQLELYKELPGRDADQRAVPDQTIDVNLQPNQQITEFLGGSVVFPNLGKFKGMIRGWAFGPVSVLALLQTPVSSGVQYATLVPTYLDALRRNSWMYLIEGTPLDADLMISDYFVNTGDVDPWDLLYEKIDGTRRQLVPQEGARFAVIGTRSEDDFNRLDIVTLRSLTYSDLPIDLSDGSANLVSGFTFAIRTGLGRYAKVRVAFFNEVPVTGGTEYDLALQILIYR